MPKFGMTMTEGTLVEWCFGIDDVVDKGAVLLIIESEKAEIEVEATASGILRHIWVEPGETVPCGSLLAALPSPLPSKVLHRRPPPGRRAKQSHPLRAPSRRNSNSIPIAFPEPAPAAA
jgi:pyruvate dehydrogenase E2 component (dihydrolipoamide acetyltransferase)